MPIINGVLYKPAKEIFLPVRQEKQPLPQVTSVLKENELDFSKSLLWDIKEGGTKEIAKTVIPGPNGTYISSINIRYINLSRPPNRPVGTQYSLDPSPFNVLYENGHQGLPHLLNPHSDRDKRITAFCYQNQHSLVIAYGQSIEILIRDENKVIPPSPKLDKPLNEKYQIDSSSFQHVFKTQKVLTGHPEDITCLIMLPGNRLASAAKDKKIKIWDLDKQTLLCEFNTNAEVSHFLLTPDFKLISAGDIHIQIWDINQYTFIDKFALTKTILGIGLLSDRRLIISTKGEPVILLDLANGKPSPALNKSIVSNLSVLPDDHVVYIKDTGKLVLCPPEVARRKPVAKDNEQYILTTDLEKKNWIYWKLKSRSLGLHDIISSLQQLGKRAVKKLNLQNMALEDKDIPELLTYLNQSKLIELDIRNTALTFTGIKALYLGLYAHPTLKSIQHAPLSAIELAHLGECYEQAKGVPADLNKAVICYQSAAAKGSAYAQFRLGAYYSNSSSPSYNIKVAIKWYLMAAKNNPVEVLYFLVGGYTNNLKMVETLTDAFIYYYNLAMKTYPITSYHVSQRFIKEERTQPSYALARGSSQPSSTELSLIPSKKMLMAQEQRMDMFPTLSRHEAQMIKKLLKKANFMTKEDVRPYARILHAVCLNLEQINLIVDIDPVAAREQEIINASPTALRDYQKYLETELSRFIIAYWIATTGVFQLSENKKGDLLNGVSNIFGALPGLGILLQIIPLALNELNHMSRAYEINNLVKLFTTIDDITRTCRQFARKCTLVKKEEILSLAAPAKDQGFVADLLDKGKKFLHEVRNNLKKLDGAGLNLNPAQELGVLHGATLIGKIMSGSNNEVEPIRNPNLVTNFLKVMGHEPPLTLLAPPSPTREVSISIIDSPRLLNDSTAMMIRSLAASVTDLTHKQKQTEEALERMQQSDVSPIGNDTQQVYALAASSRPSPHEIVHRDRFFHQENEQLRQVTLHLAALQERVDTLEKEKAKLQAEKEAARSFCTIM